MKVKNSNFVDYVKIFCRSGKGGAGSTHFLRNKTTSKGGPDGGDGGNGGNIIMKGNNQMWTLLHLRYKKHIFAKHGGDGAGNHRFGKDGESSYIEVPLGTILKDAKNEKILFEITENNEEFTILKGGMGGRGRPRPGPGPRNRLGTRYGAERMAGRSAADVVGARAVVSRARGACARASRGTGPGAMGSTAF